MPLLTVGHGALDRAGLTTLFRAAGLQTVVDIRRFPGSRRNPDVARDALAQWVPAAGIGYRWEERLGGRRHLRQAERAASPDTWWQVEAFRSYAGHTRTEEFAAALTQVVEEAAGGTVAVMCSESVWWRCHRRLVADVAVLLHGVPVDHLMHSGSRRPHQPSPGARVSGDVVVWDGVTAAG